MNGEESLCADAMTPGSPLRYAGSKARCLSDLAAHFNSLDLAPGFEYYEPMCGGLTVGLHVIRHLRPSVARIADASPDVVNFWTVVRNHYDALESTLKSIGTSVDEHRFYELRGRLNSHKDDPTTRAAVFYLLQRSCFNGVYRCNCKGEYNVPYGRFKGGQFDMSPLHWVQLRDAHVTLVSCDVSIECVGVTTFLDRHRGSLGSLGCLVYLDPPYLGTTRGLYGNDFDTHAHEHLRDLADQWRRVGAHVCLNNSPASRDLYTQWNVRGMMSTRSMCPTTHQPHQENDILVW